MFNIQGGAFGRDWNKIKSRRGQRPLLYHKTQILLLNIGAMNSHKDFLILLIILSLSPAQYHPQNVPVPTIFYSD